jgi:hypothetical protein
MGGALTTSSPGVEILIGSCVLHLGSRISSADDATLRLPDSSRGLNSVALCQDARWRGEPVREQETSADA